MSTNRNTKTVKVLQDHTKGWIVVPVGSKVLGVALSQLGHILLRIIYDPNQPERTYEIYDIPEEQLVPQDAFFLGTYYFGEGTIPQHVYSRHFDLNYHA